MKSLNLLALVALSAGCATPRYGAQLRNPLDKSIIFTEMTTGGKKVPLSGPEGQATQLPDRAEIDINSTININIKPETVQISSTASSEQARLGESQKALQETITALAEVVEVRLSALEAYRQTRGISAEILKESESYKNFVAVTKRFGTVEEKLTSSSIWQAGIFTEQEQTDAFSEPSYQRLGELLQRQLEATQQTLRADIAGAKKETGTLKLEAFLESVQATPTPIHLAGYDNLEEKQLQVRSQDALVMSESEQRALSDKLNEMSRLATQANRVRTGEASLTSVLSASGKESLDRLIKAHQDIEPLLRENWPLLIQQLGSNAKDFRSRLKGIAEEIGQSEITRLTEIAANLEGSAKVSFPIDKFADLDHLVINLKEAWQKTTPDTLVTNLARTRDAYSQAKALTSSLNMGQLSSLRRNIDQALEEVENSSSTITEATRQKLLTAAKESGLKDVCQKLLDHLQLAEKIANEVWVSAEFATIRQSHANFKVADAFEVPFIDAPNTRLELQKTTRLLDDRIFFRATLTQSTRTITSESTFIVRQFGRHSVLAPSVVLARPTQAQSSTERDFKFAPALAYLVKYYPRDTEEGWLNAAARLFQIGGGIHVAFLEQNPGKDTEIGMGLAASFWQDRIVAGIGWNLMNNSRSYLYVGSNLIPVLQALGFGNNGAAGKKP